MLCALDGSPAGCRTQITTSTIPAPARAESVCTSVIRSARDSVPIFLAKENGDELVDAGVGEEQVRRIGHEARRRHDGVLLRLEEVEKRLADLRAGAHDRIWREDYRNAATLAEMDVWPWPRRQWKASF